jgi:hypothetical protein
MIAGIEKINAEVQRQIFSPNNPIQTREKRNSILKKNLFFAVILAGAAAAMYFGIIVRTGSQ